MHRHVVFAPDTPLTDLVVKWLNALPYPRRCLYPVTMRGIGTQRLGAHRNIGHDAPFHQFAGIGTNTQYRWSNAAE